MNGSTMKSGMRFSELKKLPEIYVIADDILTAAKKKHYQQDEAAGRRDSFMTQTLNKKSPKEEISEAPQVEELLKNLEFHKSIQRITSRIHTAANLREIVIDIKEDIRRLFHIHRLSIYLIDKGKKEIYTLLDDGHETKEIRLPINSTTFAGYVAQKKKMLHIADAYNEREIKIINDALKFDDSQDEITGTTTGQIIVSPIMHEGTMLGVMEIMNQKDTDAIDDYKQIFLDEISGCLAKAFLTQHDFIQNSQKDRVRLEKLIQEGILTSDQMNQAMKESLDVKEDLATILIKRYGVSKEAIGDALADHFSCPFTPYSDDIFIPSKLLAGIEKSSLLTMVWIPLKVVKGKIHILISDPSDFIKKREIGKILETDSIQYSVALTADILKLIDRFYPEEDEALPEEKPKQAPATDLPDLDVHTSRSMTNIPASSLDASANDDLSASAKTPAAGVKAPFNPSIPKPVPAGGMVPDSDPGRQEKSSRAEKPAPVRIMTLTTDAAKQHGKADGIVPQPEKSMPSTCSDILFEAHGRRASDIHFEPDPLNDNISLRIRVDGQFMPYRTMSYGDYEIFTQTVKQSAHLDATNRAAIQNGKFKLKRPSGDEIHLRVTFIPTRSGMEDTVIHISSKAKMIPLELLGLSEDHYAELANILRQPRGVILVVGPAGAGVTTTLHACLENINTPDKKIWTAEEAVEIVQNGLRQVPIDPQKGFDFPHVLRSFLNADPDVIMINPIHDLETARLCMEASLKGRLVLGSLRADNIVDAIERCLDMGINHLVFADAMLAIVEQRLIKTLCPKCKGKYHPSREEYDELADIYGEQAFSKFNIPYSDSFSLYRPKGCEVCGHTGYGGRTCVSEIFVFTPQLKRMIRRKETVDSLYQTAISHGLTTLIQDGISKVLQGFSDNRHVRLTCLK